MTHLVSSGLLAALLVTAPFAVARKDFPMAVGGRTRTYYIAAVETEWNYVPAGMDHMTAKPFAGNAKTWTDRGKDRIGSVYRKAIYQEYTDGTFTTLKPRPAAWAHLGMMGPLIRAEVGDTVVVHFRNCASTPYSMHPHGVSYLRDSEGTPYPDATGVEAGIVPPGGEHTYEWRVPERAGPGPQDGSSIVWLYHSHNWEPKDVNAGLIGALIITRRGMARPDGSPKDVDREFATLFMLVDENQSHYLQHNIDTYTGDPRSVNKREFVPADSNGDFHGAGQGFAAANFKATINGYMFGNMPVVEMNRGEHVRWYLMTLGGQVNYHTPHWHGNVVTVNGHRTDILSLLPAQFVTADMVPDNAGTWMFHCHIDEHMEAGMMAMYSVR
jgi:FtsP/CotA-like multicopper oxidase with cupredoxin domain